MISSHPDPTWRPVGYREGWTEDGLKCFLAADDLDAATDFIADHLDKVIVDDWSRRTLARWLGMFPPAAAGTRLPLLSAASFQRTFRSDYEGVDQLLVEIDAACRDATGERQQRWRQTFQMDLGFLRAFAAFWRGDIERAYEHGGRVLRQTSGPQSFLAMSTIMYYGASLALTGRQAAYIRSSLPPASWGWPPSAPTSTLRWPPSSPSWRHDS